MSKTKTFELIGRVYEENSNRSPLMVCKDGEQYLRSFETYIKQADLFPKIVPRTVKVPMWYDKSRFVIADTKVNKQDIESQIKKVKITITVEEI